MRANRLDRSRHDDEVDVVGHLGQLRELELANLVALAFQIFFDRAVAGLGFSIVGIGLAVPVEELDHLLGALGRADDRVGQRFLGEVGNVDALAAVAAVLQMRGAHDRHLEALGELGMLVGIDQLVSQLGRVVRKRLVEFARGCILTAGEKAVELERLLQTLDHVHRLARKAVNLLAGQIEPRVMERRNIVDRDQQRDERDRVNRGVGAVARRAAGVIDDNSDRLDVIHRTIAKTPPTRLTHTNSRKPVADKIVDQPE